MHHSDAGSQYTIDPLHRPPRRRRPPPPRSAPIGDSYDNAMAEALNGTFKAELSSSTAPGAPAANSRSPSSNGSTGTTTAASTPRSATSHQPSTKPLVPSTRPRPQRQETHNPHCTKPGRPQSEDLGVHPVARLGCLAVEGWTSSVEQRGAESRRYGRGCSVSSRWWWWSASRFDE